MKRRRFGLAAAGLLFLALLAAVPPQVASAAPPGWQIAQLTSAPGSSSSYWADIDGTWLVYLQDKEVMARDLSTGETRRLSADGNDKSRPLVDDGNVIWSTVATASNATHGFLYHLPSGPLDDLGVLPASPLSYDHPRFTYKKQLTADTYAVCVYDLTTKQSTRATANGDSPSIRGSHLGYVAIDADSKWHMYYIDLTTHRGLEVSTGRLPVHCVNVTDTHVLWCVGKDDYMEVYSMDRSTLEIVRLTTDSNEDREPRQAGDLIVWQSRRGDWEVMAYDIATGETIQLTANDTDDVLPCTDGTDVYYQGQLSPGGPYQLFKASPPAPPERPFVDIPAGHYYEEAINGLYRLHIVDGRRIVEGERFYDPSEPVNRAQFAKMVTGTLGLSLQPATGAATFVDLGSPDAHGYPDIYVATMLKHGITRGVDATHYGPWLPIKRAQVVTMLIRAAANLPPGFLTDPPALYTGTLAAYTSPDHAQNLRIAEYNHLLDHLLGFGPDWDPEAPATRAECAQLMWNFNLKN